MSHRIDEWHAFQLSPTEAEIVILGEGFGPTPQAVKYIIEGGGTKSVKDQEFKEWCDTLVTFVVPVDKNTKIVWIDIPDSKGKKDRVRTGPGEERASTGATPDFEILNVIDTPENLVIQGTNLSVVDQIIGYDQDAPKLTVPLDFVEILGELFANYPPNFSGSLDKIRAVNEPDMVQEVIAPVGGWSPAEAGLIEFASGGRTASGDVITTITGIGFGEVDGDVSLVSAAGTVQVLVLSWADSAVVVSAPPKTKITDIILVDDNGLTAEIAPSAPIPFKTPGLEATIATVTQIAENPEVFRLTGTNLDQVASGDLQIDNGKSIQFFSDDVAFFDTDAAANNTAGGTSAVTYAPGQIDVTAANDVSGEFARNVVLKDLNGSTNVADDFPDIFISGLPGNPSAVANFLSPAANLAVDANPYVEVSGSGLLPAPIVINALDSGAAGVSLAEIAASQASQFFAQCSALFGERYTDWTISDDNTDAIDISTLDLTQYLQMPGAPVVANLAASSPALRQLLVEGDNLADVAFIQYLIFNPASGLNESTGAFITPGNVRWQTWQPGSFTDEDDYITQQNAAQKVVSAAATPGSPDTALIQLDTTLNLTGNPDPSGLDVVFIRAFHQGASYSSIILNAITGGDTPVTIL